MFFLFGWRAICVWRGGEEREETRESHGRALASNRFGGAGVSQIFWVYSHLETSGADPLLFYWKPNI